jgi:hypothetical protein
MADRRDKLIRNFVRKSGTPTPDQQDRKRGAIGRGDDLRGLAAEYERRMKRQRRQPGYATRQQHDREARNR